MAKFKFRAEAAMDLRRKRDDEAQRTLADARRVARAAEADLAREERSLNDTLTLALAEEANTANIACSVWLRNWMQRQRQVIEAAGRRAEERRRLERAAAEQAIEARRQLRALERLRERQWRAFLQQEHRVEQRDLDMLAGLRYVARQSVLEGVC